MWYVLSINTPLGGGGGGVLDQYFGLGEPLRA